MLYSLKVRSKGEDKMCWIPTRNKSFEVKSYYKVLLCPIQSSFPWKSIWKVKVPPRVAFFVRMTTLGKILTVDNLRKRNIIVMEWCYICKTFGESIDHLFLHCMGCYRVVEYDLAIVWGGVGKAVIGERYVGELEGAKGKPDVDTNLANDSIVFDVVCMEGTECTLF
jgi:hypothetical protein